MSISSTYLRTAFTPVAPKSVRIQSSCHYLFTLLGSTSVKAVLERWWNWAQVSISSIFYERIFLPIFWCQKISNPKHSLATKFCTKNCESKPLMKLTTGGFHYSQLWFGIYADTCICYLKFCLHVFLIKKEQSMFSNTQPTNIRKNEDFKKIYWANWSIFSKTLDINSKKISSFLMRPAKPCFQSHSAHETLWFETPGLQSTTVFLTFFGSWHPYLIMKTEGNP